MIIPIQFLEILKSYPVQQHHIKVIIQVVDKISTFTHDQHLCRMLHQLKLVAHPSKQLMMNITSYLQNIKYDQPLIINIPITDDISQLISNNITNLNISGQVSCPNVISL